jgi:hypothetical protein
VRGAGSESVDLSGVLVQGGMHLATYFASESGRLRIAAPFLREGLSCGQPCFLIASGEVLERYVEALEEDVKTELAEARRLGLFVTAPAPGRTVEEALTFWNESIWAALSHDSRPPIVRIVGDMACVKASFATVQQMLIFERVVGSVIKGFPAIALCQYDVREFDGPSLLEAMQAHPDVSDLGFEKFIT